MSVFAELCNYHHNQFQNILSHPHKSMPISCHPYSPNLFQPLATTHLLVTYGFGSCSVHFISMGSYSMWKILF